MGFLSDNFIADGIFVVIKWMFEFIHDYSIVILLITLAIRIVVLPLDIKQRKNTRMMANLGPEMESLKKRYANNPDQLNRKMQELYRERNVKPMAGCLPMILQLFLLFAFFGALRNIVSEQTVSLVLRAAHDGVENVQLPQWLWVHNLWQPDSGLAGCMPSAAEFLTFLQTNAGSITPQTMVMLQNHGLITYSGGTLQVATEAYNTLTTNLIAANGLTGLNNGWFGLPVLAGASLFFQQWQSMKQNPTMQQQGKMMLYIFPLVSVWICATSNTAFSIYWIVSNVYAILLNWILDAFYKARERKAEERSRIVERKQTE